MSVLLCAAVCASGLIDTAALVRAPQGEADAEEIRRIWDEGLVRQRKASPQSATPQYRRVTRPLPRSQGTSPVPQSAQAVVGVTVWRLRPSASDDEVRELIHERTGPDDEEKRVSMTPVRVEAETPLDKGERVRISIESSREGYLYVVDRELYEDGSKGRPLLIFPTERTLEGNNHVRAGRPVTIPAKTDDPPYFTVRPNPNRRDQVAEQLLIIISDQPLSLPLTPQAQVLRTNTVNTWEARWAAPFERVEQVGGAGRPITKAESEAAGDEVRELWQGDPAPQSVYRLRRRTSNPFLLKVSLPFKRR
ncbi:MAG TPA: DUF4384 domain-containing protein [Pyrinomonadaceae bacterium]